MDDFYKFLTWLDPDHEQAAKKYKLIQARLVRYFRGRGCGIAAEELAEDTIRRVIVKIRTLADTYVGEPLPFFLRVARNVYLEWIRKPVPVPLPDLLPVLDSTAETNRKELEDRCLRRCMAELSSENQDLILRYYVGDKHEKIVQRRKLAEELGIGLNALRIRAHRIRTELRSCVEKCVEEDSNGETDSRNQH